MFFIAPAGSKYKKQKTEKIVRAQIDRYTRLESCGIPAAVPYKIYYHIITSRSG